MVEGISGAGGAGGINSNPEHMKDIAHLQGQLNKAMVDMNKGNMPAIQKDLDDINQFVKNHPTILDKHSKNALSQKFLLSMYLISISAFRFCS